MTDNQTPESREAQRKEIAAMKALGFDWVPEVGNTWTYAKKIDEFPPYLTDGTSYLQLTRNQAGDYLQLITAAIQASNKALLERLIKQSHTYFTESDGTFDYVAIEAIEAERQQLGKESRDE